MDMNFAGMVMVGLVSFAGGHFLGFWSGHDAGHAKGYDEAMKRVRGSVSRAMSARDQDMADRAREAGL